MRRVTLLFVLGLILVGTAGCYSMNTADPFHPRPCPVVSRCCDANFIYYNPAHLRPAPAPVYMGCTNCPCATYP